MTIAWFKIGVRNDGKYNDKKRAEPHRVQPLKSAGVSKEI
jgi:hypothetical protein